MNKEIKEKKRCSYCGKISNDWYNPFITDEVRMCYRCYRKSLSQRDLMDLKLLIKNKGKKWIIKNLIKQICQKKK